MDLKTAENNGASRTLALNGKDGFRSKITLLGSRTFRSIHVTKYSFQVIVRSTEFDPSSLPSIVISRNNSDDRSLTRSLEAESKRDPAIRCLERRACTSVRFPSTPCFYHRSSFAVGHSEVLPKTEVDSEDERV